MSPRIQRRALPDAPILHESQLSTVLRRIYAARGIQTKSELDYELKSLIPPAQLTHAAEAAVLLADAIEAQAKILIVADYDCDGATACAVGVRALRVMAADSGTARYSLIPRAFPKIFLASFQRVSSQLHRL